MNLAVCGVVRARVLLLGGRSADEQEHRGAVERPLIEERRLKAALPTVLDESCNVLKSAPLEGRPESHEPGTPLKPHHLGVDSEAVDQLLLGRHEAPLEAPVDDVLPREAANCANLLPGEPLHDHDDLAGLRGPRADGTGRVRPPHILPVEERRDALL